MEQEEKKLPEGLEEAAEKYLQQVKAIFLRTLNHPTAKECFIAGAEWQAEKCDEETSKLLYAERQTAYIYGWDDHKEQMLKDAVEIEVKEDAGGFPVVPLDAIELYDYENDKPLAKAGDKVKLIIINDHEQEK